MSVSIFTPSTGDRSSSSCCMRRLPSGEISCTNFNFFNNTTSYSNSSHYSTDHAISQSRAISASIANNDQSLIQFKSINDAYMQKVSSNFRNSSVDTMKHMLTENSRLAAEFKQQKYTAPKPLIDLWEQHASVGVTTFFL